MHTLTEGCGIREAKFGLMAGGTTDRPVLREDGIKEEHLTQLFFGDLLRLPTE